MLTVVLATHNGAGTLPTMLESFTRLKAPAGGWKLIVVDNASTDETHDILASFAERLPLTVLNQPERGKNRALNLAIPHFEGDLVVFTDDDVIPRPDWLAELHRAAWENPEYGQFGGPIEAFWMAPVPEWIPRLVPLPVTFALTRSGYESGPDVNWRTMGPNMAVRAEAFRQGHRFDESMGPNSGHYIMGSETEFIHRLAAIGFPVWFNARAIVQHMIRPHQMEPEWILGRAFRYGRAERRLRGQGDKARFKQAFGVPRWMWSALVNEYLRKSKAAIAGRFEKKFLASWEINFLRGYIHEAHRENRENL